MRIESDNSDKLTWLANQIFIAFPPEVTGLKFCILECGCIYYQRVYGDSGLAQQVGIYRDAKDGHCEVCVTQEEAWEDRVINEVVVYNSKFKTDFGR